MKKSRNAQKQKLFPILAVHVRLRLLLVVFYTERGYQAHFEKSTESTKLVEGGGGNISDSFVGVGVETVDER